MAARNGTGILLATIGAIIGVAFAAGFLFSANTSDTADAVVKLAEAYRIAF